MPESDAYVLPGAVRPTKYTLKLQPDMEQSTFSGEETITIQVVEPTPEIVLNSIELEVGSAALTKDGVTSPVSRMDYDTSKETLTLRFE